MPDDLLQFKSHHHLRERLQLSILSGRSILITQIRPDDVHIGLRDYEISLLRLLEKVTNGSTIEISVTGTSLLFHPGLLPGGSYSHTCHLDRSLNYYLDALIPLAPFCKKAFDISLHGITSGCDVTRTVTLPHLHYFGITEGLELQIKKRGSAPLGGGQVIFKCPVVRQLKTLQFMDKGKIKRLRGVAFSTRVSPQFANRMVESARSVLNRFVPDVYLYTDVFKGDESGKSPGYGLTLVAQSTTSALHAADFVSSPGLTPEDLALHASRLLLEEIKAGGCIDSRHQWLVLLLMALGKEDVGRCLMGQLTPHTLKSSFSRIQYLRDIMLFFGVRFKVNAVEDGEHVVSCTGIGFSNINKSMA